ncbi:RHS repeat-associated core domain-containing protein [Pseudomonas fluorescens]|uniref:RHS repeat-associated core domain-containing protein n=1 Tax=Pseudomonas fluorescens TaxID=294 RepID=A0A5E7EBS2_PSEFL|nr:RHS repeat-associated core domain-containing protein [Pseudomonas fluorescens]VVO24411.1 hypothetical protein PS723_04477 [Pseudomonas fluorescens]
MPTSPRETVLCRYQYDPLDRQTGCALLAQSVIQRFYCKSRLATEVQGAVQTSIVQHDDQLLAQQQRHGARLDTTLVATDLQRSVLSALDKTRPHPFAYLPYGYRPPENGLLSLLGFNGERPDPVTGHYHLGNGYRQFNPLLMRFNSPDNMSPFGKGGINAYAYCEGDPRNRVDPTGHFLKYLFALGQKEHLSTIKANITMHKILRGYGVVNGKTSLQVSKASNPIIDIDIYDDVFISGIATALDSRNTRHINENIPNLHAAEIPRMERLPSTPAIEKAMERATNKLTKVGQVHNLHRQTLRDNSRASRIKHLEDSLGVFREIQDVHVKFRHVHDMIDNLETAVSRVRRYG